MAPQLASAQNKQPPLMDGKPLPKDPFKLEPQFGQDEGQIAPTFRTRTELVLVPVMVRGKSGAHVTNLHKEDFQVLENGVPQKIAIFEEVKTSTAREPRSTLEPGEFTNTLSAPESGPQRLTILALDSINTPFADQAFARQQLIKFLAQSAVRKEPTSLVVLTRWGVKIIHDFTTDPQILIAALKKVKGETLQVVDNTPMPSMDIPVVSSASSGGAGSASSPVAGGDGSGNRPTADQLMQQLASQLQAFVQQAEQDMQAFQQRVAITMTLDAMKQLAEAYRGVPGRKALIWASSGFPFSVRDGFMGAGDNIHDVIPLYEKAWKALNAANMAVYPVDVRGVTNPGYVDIATRGVPKNEDYGTAVAAEKDRISSFQIVAESTGGRAFIGRNDLDNCFESAVDDSADYYLLGYYLESNGGKSTAKGEKHGKDSNSNWRKLQVKVAQRGLSVRARSGFFLDSTQPDAVAAAADEEVQAVAAPVNYTGIQLTGRWRGITEGKDGKKKAEFQLIMPPSFANIDEADQNRLSVDFMAVAKTPIGEVAGQASQRLNIHMPQQALDQFRKVGTLYRCLIELPPGEYTVRFVVRDNVSGRIGSATAPLKIE
jgi:VWFA-related protein